MLINLCSYCNHWNSDLEKCSKYGDIFSLTRGCTLNIVEHVVRWDVRELRSGEPTGMFYAMPSVRYEAVQPILDRLIALESNDNGRFG